MSKKYWDKKVNTTDKKDSWQEPYSRETSVSARAIQAIDTLLGFSGSWMGALSDSVYTDFDSSINSNGDSPNGDPKWRVSKLGRYGYPELNFIPYNYRTNAIGSKGGSLVGHPISFSIVGPTAKTGASKHFWIIMESKLIQLAGVTDTLADIYGDLDTLVNEGLYFVVSETGAERDKEFIADRIIPRENYGQSAKFEVFRVVNIDMNAGIIAFDKSIYSVFQSVGKENRFQSLTFFVPYATRLVAVPESGDRGAEKKFLFISPEHSAFNDLNPKASDSSFDSDALLGSAGEKGHALPIPIPIKNLAARLEKGTSKQGGKGVIQLTDLPVDHGINSGDIIHITRVSSKISEEYPRFTKDRLMGWFEVVKTKEVGGILENPLGGLKGDPIPPSFNLIIRRCVEINANTGEVDYGEELYVNSNFDPDQVISVSFSVHKPVSSIFEGDYNADQVDSVRLTNLIDPNWVDRTTKRVNDDTKGTLFGGALAKADRAVFTTNTDGTTTADAGNLLDLGFRVVLFPAKYDQTPTGKPGLGMPIGAKLVPDFSRPITSNEVILDPSIQEKQTIDIDYSAGTLTLSHAPARGGELTPNGVLFADNNPRQEVVIFACCVPYSMEQGQTGTGVALSGGDLRSADHGIEKITYASTLGQITTMIVIRDEGAGLFKVQSNNKLPPSFYFTVAEPDMDLPTMIHSWSSRPNKINAKTEAEGICINPEFLGESEGSSGAVYIYQIQNLHITDPTKMVQGALILVSKQSLEFVSITEDNSYGSAFRSDKVRFAFADFETHVDGSITVFPTAVKGPAQELRSQFPLGGDLEWGRVAFDSARSRWRVSSPTHTDARNGEYQIGFEVIRGKTYLADTVYTTARFEQYVFEVSEIIPDTTNHTFEAVTTTDLMANQVIRLQEENLNALIFGETILSKDMYFSKLEEPERFVLAFRDFDGTNNGFEGVNPTNWASFLVPPLSTIDVWVDTINMGANALGFGDVALHYATDAIADGRIMITERSVEVMPVRHFLRSRPINASDPISFDEDGSMTITIRSMSPKYPDRWVTFAITTSGLVFSDHRELAAYFNRQLYSTEVAQPDDLKYIGHELESAGFYAEMNSDSNPYLNGTTAYPNAPQLNPVLTNREFPLLFIGDDDHRHPAHNDPTHPDAEKLILMLGGRGLGDNGGGDLTPISVGGATALTCYGGMRQIEYDAINSTVVSSNVLNTVLVEVTSDFGKSSQNIIALLQGDFSDFSRICNATHASSGPVFVSTDPLSQATSELSGGVVEQPIVSMKGALHFANHARGTLSSAYYLGSSDISSYGSPSNPNAFGLSKNGLSILNTPSVKGGRYHTEGGRDLSRWVDHFSYFFGVDPTNPNECGWYRSWLSLTNRIVEPYEFTQPLSRPQKAGDIPTVYRADVFRSQPEDDPISLSDYFFKGFARSESFEGIFIDAGTALVRKTSDTPSAPFNPLTPLQTIAIELEAHPRTTGFFGGHKGTFSLLQNNLQRVGARVDSAGKPSATYMSGGRIDLFSGDSARTNPSGIALGTALANGDIFLTHMEHGVFPTRYTTSKNNSKSKFYNLDRMTGSPVDFAVSEYLESSEGGVSGLRFSGDTTLWLTNIHHLQSIEPTANFFAVDSLTNGAFANFPTSTGSSDLEGFRLFIDTANYTFKHVFGGSHAPELVKGSTTGGGSRHLQEGLIVLGLTQANLDSWFNFTVKAKLGDGLYDDLFYEQNLLGDVRLAKVLQGKFITLRLVGQENPPFSYTSNEGVYRITHAPVIMSNGSVTPDSQFSSVVALRVEKYAFPSQAFKGTKITTPQYGKGYQWAITAEANSNNSLCIADVVETGGIPTNVPSSVSGITLDPQGVGQSYFPMSLFKRNDSKGDAKLYGVFPLVDSWGYPKTTAFFSTAAQGVPSLTGTIKGVIRSWQNPSMTEDFGEEDIYVGISADGRTRFSYKKRLGLGVVIDGGLGVVHATGFRAIPRPSLQTTFGGLNSFGGAFPFTSSETKTPVKVSNIFDTTEFIDDVYVVSPKGALIFEDGRATLGLGKRLQENLAANHFIRSSLNRNYSNTPNDALFPYNMGGVVFKGSGSVRYARGYNPLSASRSQISSYLGKADANGTKGMAIPNYGGCFLLPKGPPTTNGTERSNFRDEPLLEDAVPTDTPLYTFVQGTNSFKMLGLTGVGNGSISLSSIHNFNHTLGTPSVISGTGDGHEADHGGLLHGNTVPRSREFNPYSNKTIHLMEGMVVENVTNGTFYTIGEIGRIYDGNPNHPNVDAIALFPTGEMVNGDRPITQGSRILIQTPVSADVYFDLNPYVGYEGTWSDFAHGFGDRTDTITVTNEETLQNPALSANLGERTFVRSLNVGNQMRITPNVEFVPIMGEHNVDGGLIPPYDDRGRQIEDADALFYSMSHDFRKPSIINGAGDIGKFIYVCGTDCYQYTGWWVIIDVLEGFNIEIAPSEKGVESKGLFVQRDVAVVRKWKRGIGRKGDFLTNMGALPMQPRSPRLRIMGNNHFGFLDGATPFNWFDPDNCSDLTLVWKGGGATYTMTVPSAFFAGKDLITIVNDLNADPNYNGAATFGEANSVGWEFDGSYLNGVGGGNYTENAAIEVSLRYNPTPFGGFVGYDAIWRQLTSKFSTMYGYFSSNTSVIVNPTTKQDPLEEVLGQVGIFSFIGINSAIDTGWGDRNNAAKMIADNDFEGYSAAKGLRWVYSHPLTEESVGSYLHLKQPQTKYFDWDVYGFVRPSARAGGTPTWVSRYPTERDANSPQKDIYKTDIFRINKCPTTRDMVIGGDCEVYVRGVDESNSNTPFVYSPLGVSFGLWQDSVTGRVETATLYNVTLGIGWDQKPLGTPVEYALQPIAREKIVAVNPSAMSSNEILEMTPRIEIEEIDHMYKNGVVLQHYYQFRLKGASDEFQFRIPSDSISVGTPLIMRGTNNVDLDGKVAYVVGTDFEGWHPIPQQLSDVANVLIIRVYIPTLQMLVNKPLAVDGYVTVAEGLRPLNINGTDLSKPFKLRSASDLTLSSPITLDANNNSAKDYQWAPASKWWEKQVPYAYLGYNETDSVQTHKDNPAILRIDLTEAYTQAQQSGAGIGSQNPQKHPKGVRLNRIWVNFGLWGNPAQRHTLPTGSHSILGGYQEKGGVAPHQVQAITFNLKVEIPNQDMGNAIEKGKGVLPFGGRAPTMHAYNLDGLEINTESRPSKSVIDIPLYINRGAGDISPNVTDRFRSYGVDTTKADWTVGNPQYGLGIGSSSDPTHWNDLTHDSTAASFVGNATTVGIWGGIDLFAFSPTSGSTSQELNQLVQASTGIRDSVIGVSPFGSNVPPALAWDQITYMGNANKNAARSLHKNALTGLTIVHTASLTRPNRVDTTIQDSCPHSFSVALTPVANQFPSFPIDPSSGTFWSSDTGGQTFGVGRKLQNSTMTTLLGVNDKFKVGNWLPTDFGSIVRGSEYSTSMLPVGAKVWLEVTVPNTLRAYGENGSELYCTSNGAWVGQVLCSFEVENADGTAMSFDVNRLVDDE